MKATCLLFAIIFTCFAHAESLKPLEIKTGFYKANADETHKQILEQALASIPESMRKGAKKMIEKQMPKPKAPTFCFTEEMKKDPSLLKKMNQEANKKGCENKILSSGPKGFTGEVFCKNDQGKSEKIVTFKGEVKNEKKFVIKVDMNQEDGAKAGVPLNLNTTTTFSWIQSECIAKK